MMICQNKALAAYKSSSPATQIDHCAHQACSVLFVKVIWVHLKT
ncbi:hypothetical protein ES703_64100 [subsurface metagenome]